MRARSVAPETSSALSDVAQLESLFRSDFLTYLPARLIPAAVGLATVSLFTRLFSPQAYGLYALALAAGGVSMALLGGWLRECAIRFVPEKREREEEGTLIIGLLALTLGAAAVPVMLMLAVYILGVVPPDHRQLVSWVALWVAAGIVYTTLSALLQAGLRARRYTLWEGVRTVLGLGLAIAYLLLVERSVAGAFAGLLLSTVLVGGAIVRDLGLRKRMVQVGGRVSAVGGLSVLRLAAYGLPLVGWAAGREVLNLGDRFVVQWFWGSEAVGIYTSNYFLADGGAGLLFIPLLSAAGPLVMHAWVKEGPARTQALVTASTRTLLLLFLPCLAALAVLAPSLARLFLAPDYWEGAIVMPLVLAGDGLWALGQLGQKGFLLAQRTRLMLGGVLLCALVNVGLNLALVPRWGYTAAAVTTAISYGVYPVFTFFGTRQLLRWRFPWTTLLRGGLAAVCAGGFLWVGWGIWSASWLLRVGCTVAAPAVYVMVLVATGETDRGELVAIVHAIRRTGRGGGN